MGSSPSFHAARACNKHREGQFDAGEQANPTREPSRASPRRGNRHRSPNRPEYACASDGGGVGGYRGLQRCSESWSSPPVHPRHLATRRRGQRRRGVPQAAWGGKATFRRGSDNYVRGTVLGCDPHAGGRAVLEVFGPQETDGDDPISGLWRFFNELDVTWPVQAVLSS